MSRFGHSHVKGFNDFDYKIIYFMVQNFKIALNKSNLLFLFGKVKGGLKEAV